MIEQQKRKGPELPLVPVKRPRHELLLGAPGAGPGAGQQQGTPGALLQTVSEAASRLRPSARLPTDDPGSAGREAGLCNGASVLCLFHSRFLVGRLFSAFQ